MIDLSKYKNLIVENDQVRAFVEGCEEAFSYTNDTNDSIFRYLLLVYDPESDLFAEYRDLEERKRQASKRTKFVEDKGFPQELVRKFIAQVIRRREAVMLHCADFLFNEAASKVLQKLTMEEGEYDKGLKALQLKDSAMKTMKKMADEEMEIRRVIFAGDKNLEDNKEIATDYSSPETAIKNIARR